MPKERGQRGTVKRVKVRGVWCWRGVWHPYRNGKRTSAREDLGECSKVAKQVARDALREIIKRRENRIDSTVPGKLTVRGLFTEVYLPPKLAEWSKNSRRSLVGGDYPLDPEPRGTLGNHILPGIGDMLVRDVWKTHLDTLMLRLRAKLKGQALGHVLFLLKAAFNEALENDIIGKNPARRVRVPDTDESETAVLDWRQVQKVIHAPPGAAQLMARILLQCGLRRGECLALRWDDLAQPAALRIDEQFTGGELKRKLKTPGSAGTVPLPERLRQSLLDYRREVFPFSTDRDFIFCRRGQDRPLPPSRAADLLRELAGSLGLPSLTPQICRRSYATLMQQRLTPRDLADVMRHTDPAMSMKVYAKGITAEQIQAVEALDRELTGLETVQ